jgi:hypothetical protein
LPSQGHFNGWPLLIFPCEAKREALPHTLGRGVALFRVIGVAPIEGRGLPL